MSTDAICSDVVRPAKEARTTAAAALVTKSRSDRSGLDSTALTVEGAVQGGSVKPSRLVEPATSVNPVLAPSVAADRVEAAAGPAARVRSAWADYVALTKPRIVMMILVTTTAAAMIAAADWLSWSNLIWLLVGTALIAGSAGGGNQIWERVIDQRMPRTAQRPLPAARLSLGEAIAFTALIGLLGSGLLAYRFGATPALVGVLTWLLYVLVYTPLKTRTAWNTTVGAIAGALPVLIGYTAAGGRLTDASGWLLFGVLAAWQYPHFMAIAWMYRRQYAEAGFCMTTTVEPSGRSAGLQSVIGSLVLIACGVALSLIPSQGLLGWIAVAAVVVACLPMLLASWRFAIDCNDTLARRLLRSSLLVLPVVLAIATIRVFW